MIEAIQSLDSNALVFVQDYIRMPILTAVMVFFSRIGNLGLIWIFTGLALLLPNKTRRGGVFMLICLLAAYLINDLVIKELVARIRPYETIQGLRILVAPESSFSFPSGHTNTSFSAAFALTRAFGKKGAFAYIPAALIAVSRVYVGVHYPTDVLAGMIVGTIVALLVCLLLQKFVKTDFVRKNKS